MTDLITRARALSRHEHDDASIGDECADEIERLMAELDAANAVIDELLACENLRSPGPYCLESVEARFKREFDCVQRFPTAWARARALRKGTT